MTRALSSLALVASALTLLPLVGCPATERLNAGEGEEGEGEGEEGRSRDRQAHARTRPREVAHRQGVGRGVDAHSAAGTGAAVARFAHQQKRSARGRLDSAHARRLR
jgi:hypothetical protein